MGALGRLDKTLEGVTKARDLKIKFDGINNVTKVVKKGTLSAVEGIKTVVEANKDLIASFGQVAAAADPRTFLSGSFATANQGALQLVDTLARTTVALYGINAAANVLTQTFGKFYQETIGRANEYEELLLRTKTTLASTNDVFANGEKVTDPLEKIDKLSGLIDERIDSIRKKTIELAGVTSNDVVEVFSIVASQAGQIGANLEEAENLAISFAAALGTFGLPLRQARQEITSILQGNINVDSYIAQALQITSEDIRKAKSQIGGVAKFLEEKLSTAVAGQSLAAKTLNGVLSNIVDIWEIFTTDIGKSQLQPLVDAFDEVFQLLNKSLDSIRKIGSEIGKVIPTITAGLASAAGLGAGDFQKQEKAKQQVAEAVAAVETAFTRFRLELASLLTELGNQLGTILSEIGQIMGVIGMAVKEMGQALLVLTRVQIESFVNTISLLLPILTTGITLVAAITREWAKFLRLPLIQSLMRIKTTFAILEKTGVMAIAKTITKMVLFRGAIIAAWKSFASFIAGAKTAFAYLYAAFAKVVVSIAMVIAKLTALGLKFNIISKEVAARLTTMSANMLVFGNNAGVAASKMGVLALGVKKVAFAFKTLWVTMGWLALVQLAIVGIVEALGAWDRQQQKIAADKKLQSNMDYLDKTAKAAAEGGLTDLQTKLREIASQELQQALDQTAADIKKIGDEIKELEEKRKNKEGRTITRRGEQVETIGSAIESNRLRELYEEKEELEKKFQEISGKLAKENVNEEIELKAQKSKDLEKELQELRKRAMDAEFAARQRAARLEVEVMQKRAQIAQSRLAKEMRDRLEGEEGLTKEVLSRVNQYVQLKKKGEAEMAAAEKTLAIELANLDKEVADYKYDMQKQIAALQEKMGKFEMEVADYKLAQQKKQALATSDGVWDGDFGDDAVGRLTAAIVGKESGGSYSVTNKDSGAIGIGQVLPSNVPSWTLKYYGESLTPEAYRQNHAAQNAVVRGRISDRYRHFKAMGSSDELAARQVAAEWYSGNANLHTSRRREMYNGTEYPSIGDYADDIVRRMSSGSGASASAAAKPELDIETDRPEMPSTEGFEAQIAKVKDLTAKLVELQKTLQGEELAQAYDELFKDLIDPVETKKWADALELARQELQAIGEDGTKGITELGKAMQKLKAQTDIEIERIRSDIADSKTKIEEMPEDELSQEEKLEVMLKLDELEKKSIENLKTMEGYKIEELALQKSINAAKQTANEIENLTVTNQELMMRYRLKMEGVSDREIANQIELLRIARQIEKVQNDPSTSPEGKKKEIALLQAKIALLKDQQKIIQQSSDPIAQLYGTWKQELNDVRSVYAAMAQTITSEFSNALSNSVIGAIEGTKSISEAFAEMFQNIGRAFIKMATDMIAKALMMKVLGIFLPGAAPAQGFGQNYFNPMTGLGAAGPNFGLAEGGFVTSPTAALIGEGGEPEYVIPESKMNSAMQRWSGGNKGDSVLDPTSGNGSGMTNMQDEPFTPQININGGIMEMDGKQYIRRDEIPSLVQQSAKAGEERAFRKMRMSPSTRRKIGI